MFFFSNKVVVITGAANGLGKALATSLYQQGSHLALIDIDADGLDKEKKMLLAKGSSNKISVHIADISNQALVAEVYADIVMQHKRVDILINNAGVSISNFFLDTDMDDYRQLFDVNFWGTVYCSKCFLPALKLQPDSRIVNVISDFAMMGFPGKAAYSSSKSAVMGFSNTLQTELYGSNVSVCQIVPPPMATSIVMNGKHFGSRQMQAEQAFLEKNGMPLDVVAKKILKGVEKGTFRVVIGRLMWLIDVLSRLFPSLLHRQIGARKAMFNFI